MAAMSLYRANMKLKKGTFRIETAAKLVRFRRQQSVGIGCGLFMYSERGIQSKTCYNGSQADQNLCY